MTDVLPPSSAPDSSTPTPQGTDPTQATANGAISAWPEGVPTHMSWEEYLAWDFEDRRAEWVDGKVVLMPPVRADHQFIVQFLYELLIGFVRPRKLGRILLDRMLMRMLSRPSGREPDLLFIATAHLDRLKETMIDGPADLVVEVVSPESDQRDRSEKFREYEAGGVPEYWLLDPLRREAYFYVLGEDGRYHLAPIGPDGVYHSQILQGFRLRVDWLWRVPLPEPDEALSELAD
jgi:Uma2 family endonuclease